MRIHKRDVGRGEWPEGLVEAHRNWSDHPWRVTTTKEGLSISPTIGSEPLAQFGFSLFLMVVPLPSLIYFYLVNRFSIVVFCACLTLLVLLAIAFFVYGLRVASRPNDNEVITFCGGEQGGVAVRWRFRSRDGALHVREAEYDHLGVNIWTIGYEAAEKHSGVRFVQVLGFTGEQAERDQRAALPEPDEPENLMAGTDADAAVGAEEIATIGFFINHRSRFLRGLSSCAAGAVTAQKLKYELVGKSSLFPIESDFIVRFHRRLRPD